LIRKYGLDLSWFPNSYAILSSILSSNSSNSSGSHWSPWIWSWVLDRWPIPDHLTTGSSLDWPLAHPWLLTTGPSLNIRSPEWAFVSLPSLQSWSWEFWSFLRGNKSLQCLLARSFMWLITCRWFEQFFLDLILQ